MNPVEEQLLAYNDRDLERFVSVYAPDVVFENGENKLLIKGLDQIRKDYGNMFATYPELHCKVISRINVGDYVVDEEEITGRGSPTPMRAVVIYRVSGDKIVHVRILR